VSLFSETSEGSSLLVRKAVLSFIYVYVSLHDSKVGIAMM